MEERVCNINQSFRLMVAPLQGLTEAAWRSVHFRKFGLVQGEVEYFTPFVRVEKGEVRARDLRDFTSELNEGMMLTPQIIFKDVDEWKMLVDALAGAGATRIDMNMGCPFPPQVKKGRGAGLLTHPDVPERIACAMAEYTDLRFSVKMRLGVSDVSGAQALTDILNAMPLRHITIHPRTAVMQYRGALLLDEMAGFCQGLNHPVIFNGDITTPQDIKALEQDYAGVMVGRGLLARPSLFAEYASGEEWDIERQQAAFLDTLASTTALLEQRLSGPAHLRDKMKAYWEYPHPALDRKTVKAGRKGIFL